MSPSHYSASFVLPQTNRHLRHLVPRGNILSLPQFVPPSDLSSGFADFECPATRPLGPRLYHYSLFIIGSFEPSPRKTDDGDARLSVIGSLFLILVFLRSVEAPILRQFDSVRTSPTQCHVPSCRKVPFFRLPVYAPG